MKLWLISLIIGLKGLNYLTAGSPQVPIDQHDNFRTADPGAFSTTAVDSSLRLPTHFLPIEFWGSLIILISLVAMFCSYCHLGRDRYGYMLLGGFSWGWATCYAVSPLLLNGPTSAFQGMLSWIVFGLFALYSASDPDAVVIRVRTEDAS